LMVLALIGKRMPQHARYQQQEQHKQLSDDVKQQAVIFAIRLGDSCLHCQLADSDDSSEGFSRACICCAWLLFMC
jgi:hypothetical protein